MKEAFYRERLQKQFAIEVLVPEEDDMVVVDRIIYDELCQGRTKAASRRTCAAIIGRLVGRGAEGIVLGCTELPLLVRFGDTDVPVFDTTRLHAEAAVNLALAEG
jgi:aspartate racemase